MASSDSKDGSKFIRSLSPSCNVYFCTRTFESLGDCTEFDFTLEARSLVNFYIRNSRAGCQNSDTFQDSCCNRLICNFQIDTLLGSRRPSDNSDIRIRRVVCCHHGSCTILVQSKLRNRFLLDLVPDPLVIGECPDLSEILLSLF